MPAFDGVRKPPFFIYCTSVFIPLSQWEGAQLLMACAQVPPLLLYIDACIHCFYLWMPAFLLLYIDACIRCFDIMMPAFVGFIYGCQHSCFYMLMHAFVALI